MAGPGKHWDVGDVRFWQITDPGIIPYMAMQPSLAVNADLTSSPWRSISRRQSGVELKPWTRFVVFSPLLSGAQLRGDV